MGHPTIYPTGVTLYNPDKAWNGFTIIQAPDNGALLLGMNGHEIRMWKDVHGFPNKMFPGGMLMGSTGTRHPKHGLQDQLDLVQIDWDGNIVWKFDRAEFVEDPGQEPRWMARQLHRLLCARFRAQNRFRQHLGALPPQYRTALHQRQNPGGRRYL